jgi:transcriptional regulator with XRE-family HTH domain
MSEREAFGPNLRRLRVQRGISLERIAASTKVSADLWGGLERGDLSRWPTGIYARAYIRTYATEIGADADATVDTFCRLFPQGDRRAERVVRGQAAIMGHDLRWKDDLVGSVTDEKRAAAAPDPSDLPPVAFTRTGRLAAAVLDLTGVAAAAAVMHAVMPGRLGVSIGVAAVAYHAVSLVAIGCTPAVWTIETYLASRHPTTSRAGRQRFPRLLPPAGQTAEAGHYERRQPG